MCPKCPMCLNSMVNYPIYGKIPYPGLVASFLILVEKRNDEKKDIEEHDELQDDIWMKLNKEGTYYRKWKAWNQGDLRKGIIN